MKIIWHWHTKGNELTIVTSDRQTHAIIVREQKLSYIHRYRRVRERRKMKNRIADIFLPSLWLLAVDVACIIKSSSLSPLFGLRWISERENRFVFCVHTAHDTQEYKNFIRSRLEISARLIKYVFLMPISFSKKKRKCLSKSSCTINFTSYTCEEFVKIKVEDSVSVRWVLFVEFFINILCCDDFQ